MKLPCNYSKDCVDRLIKCGMAEPCQDNGSGKSFISAHPLFNPVRHIPPTNPTNDTNASPVTGKTMIATKSMQNSQVLTKCAGLNKYICKYIGSVDEKARVQLKINTHDQGTLMSKATFLHNTKISSSKKNEDLAKEKERGNNLPPARLAHLTEMFQYVCGYGEVLTDLVDEVLPTQPLEHRTGVETIRNKSNIEDGADLVSISHTVRKALDLPKWRQHTDSELLILQGSLNTSISIDKITKFSLRPPELRFFFDQPGNYYRYVFCYNYFVTVIL